MAKVWLNERGKKVYPFLANEWLAVYGYDPILHSFIIWDEITREWVNIPIHYCVGRENEEVAEEEV